MWRKPRGQSRGPVSGSGQSKVAATGAREGGVRDVGKPGVRRGGLSEEVTGGGRATEGAQGRLEVLTGPGTCIMTPFSSMAPGKQREEAEDCADREGWVRSEETQDAVVFSSFKQALEWTGTAGGTG